VLASLSRAAFAAEACCAESPEQQAARQAWEKKVGPKMAKKTAFRFVKESPALPRVLLIGDSISIGYTPAVQDLLAGKANVLRIPMNGGDTRRGLENLSDWLGDRKWDVIHFNFGLHDLKYMKDGKLDLTGERGVQPEDYGKNLGLLVERLADTGAELIWATTTPVPEGSDGRAPGDAAKYNAIAAKVMKEHGVATDDLHNHVLPELEKHQRPANVHFTEEGSAFLAEQVAKSILEALERRVASQ
jgi:acyl-CoA thioesterase-1